MSYIIYMVRDTELIMLRHMNFCMVINNILKVQGNPKAQINHQFSLLIKLALFLHCLSYCAFTSVLSQNVDKANICEDRAKASGAGAHFTHTKYQVGLNTRHVQREARPSDLQSGSWTYLIGTRQCFSCYGQSEQSKGGISSI